MIINRYLISETFKPLAVLSGVLLVIFVSYSAARYLTEAADGLIPPNTVLALVFLKTLIALEVLLPISLYLSVVMGMGRLYTDHEMTALNATGFSELQAMWAVLWLSLGVALLVGCLSLYGRPWAYQQTYRLQAQAEAEFDFNKLKPRRFYEGTLGGRTFFAERIDSERHHLEQVFIKREMGRGNRFRVIIAEEGYQPPIGPNGIPVLILRRGHIYELDRDGTRDHIVKFGELTLRVEDQEAASIEYRRKAASTRQLLQSDYHKDVAELQWRLSTPLTTVLLALLAIPVSRTSPRRGKYAKLVVAVVIYAVYFNLGTVAKTWVEEEMVGSVPGIWWNPALLGALLLILLQQPVWIFWFRGRFRRKGVYARNESYEAR